MDAIDPHKTRFSAPLAVAFAMGAALVLGSFVSAVRLTNIDRDISELRAQHVFKPEEIRELVRTETKALWKQKRDAVRLNCNAFPSKGVYTNCTEAP